MLSRASSKSSPECRFLVFLRIFSWFCIKFYNFLHDFAHVHKENAYFHVNYRSFQWFSYDFGVIHCYFTQKSVIFIIFTTSTSGDAKIQIISSYQNLLVFCFEFIIKVLILALEHQNALQSIFPEACQNAYFSYFYAFSSDFASDSVIFF